MKANIIEETNSLLNSKLLEEVLNGKYDRLINIDVESIVKRFNKGDQSVLEEEDTKLFVDSELKSDSIIRLILNLKTLLTCKNDFLKFVENRKDKMIYNPEEVLEYRDGYNIKKCSYQKILDTIEIAEQLLNGTKIYQLLRFCLKYESLRNEIKERICLVKGQQVFNDTREKILEVLRNTDHEVGIVRIEDTEKGVQVIAGTKSEMALSDLIGKPFETDMDREGYDYGPHGDYWMPARKVVKTFYPSGETALHQKMIARENRKRSSLRLTCTDEKGYIVCSDSLIMITRQELIEAGVNPERVGWKPLKLTICPTKLRTYSGSYGKKLSVGEKVTLKKSLIIKGR